MTSNQSSLVGHIIDDKVRLEAMLGQGGMGAVYRGRHLLLDRTVAVKVLRPEIVTVEGALERFFREARMAAATEHPNIVTVYDFGKLPDGGAYLILEFVEGKNLRTILQEQGALPPSLALPILGQVCAAVEFAHRRNVIHRDLKPDNIMLKRRDDGSITVKVLDFGLAKTLEEAEASSSITRTGELVGTPAYMSPEHCSGDDVDARSDLYSLGVIAYEMLSGQPPFRGRVAAVLTAQMQQPPTPLCAVNPHLSPPLESAVMAALAKKPADRPASVADWWAQLASAYTATYGEQPPAVIALPRPASADGAPATTGAVALGKAAPSQSQLQVQQASDAQDSQPVLGTIVLGTAEEQAGQRLPSARMQTDKPAPTPRVGTGTLSISRLLDQPAQVSATVQTVVAAERIESPQVSRLQRVGLMVGGAVLLAVIGGVAATSWMHTAPTPQLQPTPAQVSGNHLPPEATSVPVGTPADTPLPALTPAADPDAGSNLLENAPALERDRTQGMANNVPPLGDSETSPNNSPAVPSELPAAGPTASSPPVRQPNKARPPADTRRSTPPPPRPPESAANPPPRSGESRQARREQRDDSFVGAMKKVGRGIKSIFTGRDKEKPRRSQDSSPQD